MSGHSKWHNRVHRKSRQDAKKGAVYSKMAREIMVAVRAGGPEPESNAALRLAIERAKAARVPMENIQRAIQRASGAGEAEQYEEVSYEGYGPGGVAVYVEALTDNRNRTTSEVRYLFTRNGGNLAEAGSVAWMFDRKGYLVVSREENPVGEEEILEWAADAGAEDVRLSDDAYEVITAPDDLEQVRQALAERGLRFAEVSLSMLPKTEIRVEGKEAEQALRLLEALEEHDDVQNVYSNLQVDEEEMARLEG
ncbi:MAG: YebC/PmpR family DNA-binding transcriptional regulator [Clostridia bacterium]|nr:YebC/PmpR family DNA-binding transcriptional regulator [Clostridia bacterium]MCL6521473.1 YebC/PmpR family DNA-binding transcriptional regulator [Bacillota bacterium]